MSHTVDHCASQRPVLAVFDFDGTLTYCDSLFPFLRQVADRWLFWWNMLQLSPLLLAYRAGFVGRTRAKEAVLRKFLRGRPVEELRLQAERYATSTLPELLNPEAICCLRKHLIAGHRVVVVSASQDAYVTSCVKRYGVRETLATELAENNGLLTGSIQGKNCYGQEKLRRLQQHIGLLSDYTLYVYGDSRGDHELLAVADHGFMRPFRRRGFGRRSLWLLLSNLL